VDAWLGQYWIYVSDLDRAVALYESLGLECTSRTEIEGASEAICENPYKGGKLQLAQKSEGPGTIDPGNAFWKLYVATNDIERMHEGAIASGFTDVSAPERQGRWPMTIAFVRDPDGYLLELTQRHPWQDGDSSTYSWLNQFCINVTDLEAAVRFYETLGLRCTSRTEIEGASEAICENPEKGGKVQLARHDGQRGPIDMGSAFWKLYVNTDDCRGLHDIALRAGYRSLMTPKRLQRWPTTVAFVEDPDGYRVELVERHPD